MIGRRPFESLYVHVPFCHGKCSYCAFYSLGKSELGDQRGWLNGLLETMGGQTMACNALRSIFIGGGTPTALDDDLFQQLLNGVRRCFQLADDVEWTVEANPESLTEEKISIMGQCGVTRVSMGIQSFAPHIRGILGRCGHLDNLEKKVEALRKAGIRHLNFDFIYNIPGQKPSDFASDLRKALSFEPDHVSAYALTMEEGTPLASVGTDVNDDDFLEYWRLADDILGEEGLLRYEISNFAKAGGKCRHNDDVWHGGTYLGVGPAATSFDGLDRWTQVADLAQWLKGVAPEVDQLPEDRRMAEILAFGMRTVAGWTWRRFTERTGVDAKLLRGRELSKLQRLGLVKMDEEGVCPTNRGLLFNDEVVMELL